MSTNINVLQSENSKDSDLDRMFDAFLSKPKHSQPEATPTGTVTHWSDIFSASSRDRRENLKNREHSPPMFPVDLNSLPEYLKKCGNFHQWMWNRSDTSGKWTKVPTLIGGGSAKDRPGSLRCGSLSDLRKSIRERAATRSVGAVDALGVAVLFDPGFDPELPEDPMFDGLPRAMWGIDVDGCVVRGPGGQPQLTPGARRLVESLGTYAEFSPSDDTGIKLFFRGAFPFRKHKYEVLGEVDPLTGDPLDSEATGTIDFKRKGYFTVTSRRVPGCPNEIAEADTQQLAILFGTDAVMTEGDIAAEAFARGGETDTFAFDKMSKGEIIHELCDVLPNLPDSYFEEYTDWIRGLNAIKTIEQLTDDEQLAMCKWFSSRGNDQSALEAAGLKREDRDGLAVEPWGYTPSNYDPDLLETGFWDSLHGREGASARLFTFWSLMRVAEEHSAGRYRTPVNRALFANPQSLFSERPTSDELALYLDDDALAEYSEVEADDIDAADNTGYTWRDLRPLLDPTEVAVGVTLQDFGRSIVKILGSYGWESRMRDLFTGKVRIPGIELPRNVGPNSTFRMREEIRPVDRIYSKDGKACRITSVSKSASGTPVYAIEPLSGPSGHSAIDKIVGAVKRGKNSESQVHIPQYYAAAALDEKTAIDECIPACRSIVSAPIMDSSGAVICSEGYFASSKILAVFGGEQFHPVPKNPTREQARKAAAFILDFFDDLTPSHPVNRFGPAQATLLSVILSVVGRNLCKTCPAFALTSKGQGSGKTTVATIAAYGTMQPYQSLGFDDSEEFQKQVTAMFSSGMRIINIDNVTKTFGNAAIASSIVGQPQKGRIFGSGEMVDIDLSNTVLMMSGNGLKFHPDMFRRTVVIDLAPMKPAGDRKHPDILRDVNAARKEIIYSALVILQCWGNVLRRTNATHIGALFSRLRADSALADEVGIDPTRLPNFAIDSFDDWVLKIAAAAWYADPGPSEHMADILELRDPDEVGWNFNPVQSFASKERGTDGRSDAICVIDLIVSMCKSIGDKQFTLADLKDFVAKFDQSVTIKGRVNPVHENHSTTLGSAIGRLRDIGLIEKISCGCNPQLIKKVSDMPYVDWRGLTVRVDKVDKKVHNKQVWQIVSDDDPEGLFLLPESQIP